MAEARIELRKFLAPEVLFGQDARALCGTYAERVGVRRILLVSDPGVIEAGWVSPVIEDLEAHGIDVVVFSDVSPNPRSAQVAAGARLCTDSDCAGIVAVGGGSPMDCAKGIGVVVSNGGDVLDYAGVDKISIPMPPLICIPTTAGTGADVSQFAIIKDEGRGTKVGLISKSLVPDLALVDPVVLTTMDAELTAATGVDALVHAVEAFVSNASWEITDIHALSAMRIIPTALPACLEDPEDISARREMALASLHAGLAFSNASLGAVHALAHALGGRLDTPHGECNATLLGAVMRRTLPRMPVSRVREMAEALGVGGVDIAASVADWFDDFSRELGINSAEWPGAPTDKELEEVARHAYADACMATNPWRPEPDDLIEMLHDALD